MKKTVSLFILFTLFFVVAFSQNSAVIQNDKELNEYKLIQGLLKDNLKELALKQITDFLEKNQNSKYCEELSFKKGEILFEKGDFENASKLFHDYLNTYESGKEREKSLYFGALSNKYLNNLTTAKILYQKLLALENGNSELKIKALEELSRLLYEEGDYAGCIAVVESGDFSKNSKLSILLADSYLGVGEFDEAAKLYNSILEQFQNLSEPEKYNIKYSMGLISYNKGNYKQAVEFFHELYSLEKRNDVGTAYGWSLYKIGDYAKAYDIFSELQGSSSLTEKEKEYINIERTISLGQNSDAIEKLRSYCDKYPQDLKARRELVDFLLSQDLADEAIPHQKFIANNGLSDEKSSGDWYRLGELYFFHKRDYKSGLNVFLKVAKMSRQKELSVKSLLMAAKCHIAAGQDREALKVLGEIPYEDSQSELLPEVYFLCAQILRHMGDDSTAQDYYSLVLKNYSKSEFWKKALYNKSLLNRKEGDLEQAASGLETYLTGFDGSVDSDSVLSILGDIYFDMGDFERCLSALNRMEKPSDYRGNLRKGIASFKLGQYSECRAYLSGENSSEAAYWTGLSYEKEENIKACLEEYEKSYKGDIGSLYGKMSLLNWSEIMLKNGDIAKAVDALDILVKKGGLYGKLAQNIIERTYLSRGEIKKAVERIPSFYENNPKGFVDAVKILEKAKKFLFQENKIKAEKFFTEVITSYPSHRAAVEASFNLGELSFEKRDYEKAAQYYSKVVNFDGESDFKPQSWFKLGNCYIDMKDYAHAAGAYRKVLESGKLPEKEYLIHYLKGISHQQESEPEKAVAQYVMFLEKVPPSVKMIEEKVRVALYLQEEGYFDESILFCNSLLEMADDDDIITEAQYYKAENYKGLEEWDKALVEYLKVTYLHAENAMWAITARFEAGKIYEKKGQWQEAIKLYRKIAEKQQGSKQGEYAEKKLEELKEKTVQGSEGVTQETLED